MLDIKLIRENKELVKENIKKKFQDEKLPLVDEVVELDSKIRDLKLKGDNLRKERNTTSDEIGKLFKEKKTDAANEKKQRVVEINNELEKIEKEEEELSNELRSKMMIIPQMIDPSVPIGKDDSENVEVERFGEPIVHDYEIPYHADICESLMGLDKDASGRTSGNGFYFLTGNIARLHSAMLSYARDFMINKGFTYCLPPFMIRSDVVNGVMSFKEMENMMYKIEGEDLYLIVVNAFGVVKAYDTRGNDITQSAPAQALEEAAADAEANRKDYLKKDTKAFKKLTADDMELTALAPETYNSVTGAYQLLSGGETYYGFTSRTFGFGDMQLVTRFVLDGTGTIVSMNADELILEKEYFSAYELDEPSYKSGFAGVTVDSFTGEETLISGATISSNAVKTAVNDVFATFKSLQENGGI